MKTRLSTLGGRMAVLFALVAGLGATAFAIENHHADAPASTEARSTYPLDTCVVSGDKLGGGDMGPPVDYIHKEEGKPDRLVRFCCKSCIEDFKKDPARYLKKIDDAAAAKTHDDHAGH